MTLAPTWPALGRPSVFRDMAPAGPDREAGAIVEIDLGLDRDTPEPDTGRGLAGRSGSALLVAVMCCLVLVGLTVTASAAPPRPALVEVGTVDARATSYAVAGDLLLVISRESTSTRSRTVLTAVETATGEERWAVPYGSTQQTLQWVEATGGAIVIFSGLPGTPTTTVRDAGTGAVLWSRPNWLNLSADGRTLLSFESAEISTLVAYDVQTGRMLWSAPAATAPGIAEVPSVDQIAVIGADGVVETRNIRTGAVAISRRALENGASVRFPLFYPEAILVWLVDPDKSEIVALDRATLAVRWRSQVGRAAPSRCGALLCLTPTDRGTGAVRAVDPLTGRTVWTRYDWGQVGTLTDRIVAYEPLPTGMLVAVAVVDPRTGRRAADLRGWTVATQSPNQPAVLTRRVRDSTEIAILHGGGAPVRSLGRVPYREIECRAAAGSIACKVDNDRLVLWRYRG